MGEISTGTTITFQTGFCAEITAVNFGGMSRPVIDLAHMGSTDVRAQAIGKLYMPGALTVELLFDPDTAPPIAEDAESVTVTFPDSTTWVGTGALTDFSWGAPLEDKMTASATLSFTGAITVT